MKRLGGVMALLSILILRGEEVDPEAEARLDGDVQELPQWQDEDWEALKSGELVPGSSIFGEIALKRLMSGNQDPIKIDPSVRNLPEMEPAKEEWSTVIDGQYLSRYFDESPKSFLTDPQDLLTNHEKLDCEGFLEYHAADSGLNLYCYLFDARQVIPEGQSIEGLVERHFENSRPAAVVFYFMGAPERTEMVYTGNIAGEIGQGNQRDLLTIAVGAAQERQEPLAQFEAFNSQLSKRLFWLEKVLKRKGVLNERLGEELASGEDGKKVNGFVAYWHDFRNSTYAFYGVIWSLAVIVIIGIWFLTRSLLDRHRVFVFPDVQGSPLLGAPHAPGVGSVISYANRTQPPSTQKNDFPDYLQRM